MMNHTFHKPMSADYARLVATRSANKSATNTKLTKPTERAAVDLLTSTSSTASEATAAAISAASDATQEDSTAEHKKKTWWRQLVLSQSTFAMLKAPSRRG
ncbi:hypothetical protein Gpo141_00015008, partial [Globisporangium polare]